MDYSKQLDNYKKQAVYSMTQGEMLMLLYDELLKRLKRSKIRLQKEDFENFEADMTRAKDIVRYLRKILNMSYPISIELSRLYTFYESHMSRIIASRKASQIDELIPMIEDLKEAFYEADIKTKGLSSNIG
ncbi:MAG: flagellar export chaperone FliS [Anaerovoracaceae bacterium]